MNTGKRKDVLTTGQVARICNVAPRTVSKWFDTGQLRGYRIPGSKDRRIPVQALIRFMKAHGMPLSGLDAGQTRVLLVDNDAEMLDLLSRALNEEGRYDARTSRTAFEAGMALENFRPHVVLMDISLPDLDTQAVARLIAANPDLQGIKLIAAGASVSEGEMQGLQQQGYDRVLRKPFEIRQVVRAIEEAMAVTV